MKKMFKAAASLAVGCALLSTSAFAALEGSVVESETAGTYTASVTKADATAWESTILVLKAGSVDVIGETPVIASTVSDSDIYYINQTSAESATATYSIAESTETLYVFAGGSGEDAALYLGSIDAPAAEPEKDYFTESVEGVVAVDTRNISSSAAKWYSDAFGSGAKKVKIEPVALSADDAVAANYMIQVVKASDEKTAVDGAEIYYSTEGKFFIVLVPSAYANDYKFALVEGENVNTATEIAKFGNVASPAAVNTRDANAVNSSIKYFEEEDGNSLTSNLLVITADVNGDANINTRDGNAISNFAKYGDAFSILESLLVTE